MAESGLHLLCFVSRISPELESLDLRAIVEQSAVRNRASDIGSFMVSDGGFFAQIIEGPFDSVYDLVARLRRDPRHTDMQVVRDHPSEQREFSEWAMAAFDFDRSWGDSSPVRELRERLHSYLSASMLGSQRELPHLFTECLRQHQNHAIPADILIEPRQSSRPR